MRATGGEADFRGEDHAVYNALSARNLSLNLLFEHDRFTSPHSKLNIHGSWVRAAYFVVRVRTGRLLHVLFHAKDPHRAIITEPGCSPPVCAGNVTAGGGRHVLAEGAPPFVVDNLRVSLVWRKTLTLTTGRWRVRAQSTVDHPHLHKLRMNVELKPTYDVDADRVAPHGLLGQAYDRDQLAVDGARDDYSRLDDGSRTKDRAGVGGRVTTKAQAEGAIEGAAEDYRMASAFTTYFRFARFDAVGAPVRNVSALGGRKGAAHVQKQPGRERG